MLRDRSRAMSSYPHAAERVGETEADGVRREAYERALARVWGRPGLCETLSDEQLARLRAYTGPEIAGRADDVRRKTKN